MVIAALLLSLMMAPYRAVAVEINRVVLRVNDRIVSLYDYEKLKSERIVALSRAEMPEAQRQQLLSTVGVTVMKEMFDETLLLSRADQLGLSAAEGDVRTSMDRTKAGFGITSDEEFETALASNGMTRESFRAQIEKNLLIRQVMGREVYSQVTVEDEDLRRYYQQNPEEFREPARRNLREIVVLETEQTADERQSLGAELRSNILAGEADEAVATYEQDGLTTGWIDLGWVEVGDLDPQLEAALADLGPGSVSEPTAARGGLHVIQIVEFQEPRLKPFNDVSAAIERRLSDEGFAGEMDSYMRDLEQKAYIESDPPPEAAGFRSGSAGDRRIVDPLEAQLSAQSVEPDQPEADEPSPEDEAPEDAAPEPPSE